MFLETDAFIDLLCAGRGLLAASKGSILESFISYVTGRGAGERTVTLFSKVRPRPQCPAALGPLTTILMPMFYVSTEERQMKISARHREAFGKC